MEPAERQQVCVQVRRECVGMQWERGSSSLFELRVDLGAMSDVAGHGERNERTERARSLGVPIDAVSRRRSLPDGEVWQGLDSPSDTRVTPGM